MDIRFVDPTRGHPTTGSTSSPRCWPGTTDWSGSTYRPGRRAAVAVSPTCSSSTRWRSRDCVQRNQVPKVHVYRDHVFLVLHAPCAGAGRARALHRARPVRRRPNYLVTVHGPLNPAVDPAAAHGRSDSGAASAGRPAGCVRRPPTSCPTRWCPRSPGGCGSYTAILTQEVWGLEQTRHRRALGDPEKFLDEMFRARHGLLTVQTMAALSREVYARMAKIRRVRHRARASRWSRTPSTSSTGCGRWPTARRTTCRARSSSTRPAPTPR